jgi:hypothetical protein
MRLTEKNLLQEPFVLIDVGVQGGANIRWNPLGEYLVVHGFDPIEETIAELRRSNAGKLNHHYIKGYSRLRCGFRQQG